MLTLLLLPFLKLLLGHVELFRYDDRLMAILNEELPGLPVVSLTLCKKILLEGLLEDGVATVLLIPECPDDILTAPFAVP